MVLPLGGAMVIDPMDLMCNHHLTPTRGSMGTVNRNLNGAKGVSGAYQTPSIVFLPHGEETSRKTLSAPRCLLRARALPPECPSRSPAARGAAHGERRASRAAAARHCTVFPWQRNDGLLVTGEEVCGSLGWALPLPPLARPLPFSRPGLA